MKTICKENKNGMTARADEFCDLASAIRFIKEKKNKATPPRSPNVSATVNL